MALREVAGEVKALKDITDVKNITAKPTMFEIIEKLLVIQILDFLLFSKTYHYHLLVF